MNSLSSMDTRLLIIRGDVVRQSQTGALLNAIVEIQNTLRFFLEVGIPRKNPKSMLPGTDRII